MTANIYWQSQTISNVPGDLDWLSLEEQAVYTQFRFPKRQKEWLSGRYVAKTLLKTVNSSVESLRFDEMTVRNKPDGAPFIVCGGERLPGSLSLSHRGCMATAAWCDSDKFHIGIDLEVIEEKSKGFIEDYFTESEAAAVLNLPTDMVHLAASLIWSGKEAILKALQIGLRADTRAMEIEVPAFSNLSSGNAWSRMVVNRYPEVQGGMNLFWRLTGDYVITLAIMGNRLSQQVPAAAIIQVC